MTSQGKVLVVDDDPAVLIVIRRVLSLSGYQVIISDKPVEAVEVARQQKPAVVLTDTVMPGFDGYEVVRRIRELGIVTELVVMTGHVEPIKVLDAYLAGASDYLLKPLLKDELLPAVERAMERYRRWRQVVLTAGKERTKDAAGGPGA